MKIILSFFLFSLYAFNNQAANLESNKAHTYESLPRVRTSLPLDAKNLLQEVIAEKMDLDRVKFWLYDEKTARELDEYGNNAMHYYAEKAGDVEIFNLLMSAKTKPGIKNKFGQTPLMLAVIHNNYDQVMQLLKFGINQKDKNGNNVMHLYAKYQANIALFDILIKSGAQATIKNKKGQTPLMLAVRNGNVDYVRQFLPYGINKVDNEGRTALHFVTNLMEEQEKIIFKILINNGAKILKDNKNLTIYDYKRAQDDMVLYQPNSIKIVRPRTRSCVTLGGKEEHKKEKTEEKKINFYVPVFPDFMAPLLY